MTQDELSHVSGFSRFYISGIEGGRRNPTVHVLDVLAEALGVTAVDLLRPDRRRRPSSARGRNVSDR